MSKSLNKDLKLLFIKINELYNSEGYKDYQFWKENINPLYNEVNKVKFNYGNLRDVKRLKNSIEFTLHDTKFFINKYGVLFFEKVYNNGHSQYSLDSESLFKEYMEGVTGYYHSDNNFINRKFIEYLLEQFSVSYEYKKGEKVYKFK